VCRRRYGRSTTTDRVSVYAEIYDNTGAKPHSLDLKAEIRSEYGELTPVVTLSRSSDDLKSSGGTLRLDAPLPLAKLAAGRYVLSWMCGGAPAATRSREAFHSVSMTSRTEPSNSERRTELSTRTEK
jgi:hypothetical protein